LRQEMLPHLELYNLSSGGRIWRGNINMDI
jgi:hypothetical protein